MKLKGEMISALQFICVASAVAVLLVAGCVQCECEKGSIVTLECPFINDREVEKTFFELRNVTDEREELDRMLINQGVTIDPTAKVSDISLLRRHWRGPIIHMYEQTQLPFHAVTSALIKKYHLTPIQIQEMLPLVPMVGPYSKQAKLDCEKAFPVPICDTTSSYRTFDGTCNNLEHPLWGSANSCARRLLPAYYSGDSGFRESILGGALPEPRDLSINIHSDLNRQSTDVTNMFVFFGQFLSHDILQTPISVTAINRTIDCCLVKDTVHPQCAPISIKPDDYFYAEYGVQCINFVRSAICPTCSLGERSQINEITAFIDASQIYGNHLDESDYLRTNDGTGKLRSYKTPYGDLLPASAHPENDQCSFLNTSFLCFESGDARSNQHNSLTSLHILFLREHNRLATDLGKINPQWDDERIFQETRRIIGAELQVITYKEYLPVALGPERMSRFSLSIGSTTDYDPNLDPSLYTEFSTAGLRFGHSLVNSVVADIQNPSGNETRLLRDDYFKPFELQSGLVGPHLFGTTQKPCQWFGRNLVPDVNNFLYRRFHGQAGLDLASINIQRGRDHGLPPYTEVVEYCTKTQPLTIHDFDDLASIGLMSPENTQLLQQNYRHVDDIDLWTGILSETAIENSFLGPTGTCILGLQFHNLKFGDRFYFEHQNQKGSFSPDQLQELRKTTLTRIVCANTHVQEMQRDAFHFENESNPFIDCGEIEKIDLSSWKEKN